MSTVCHILRKAAHDLPGEKKKKEKRFEEIVLSYSNLAHEAEVFKGSAMANVWKKALDILWTAVLRERSRGGEAASLKAR